MNFKELFPDVVKMIQDLTISSNLYAEDGKLTRKICTKYQAIKRLDEVELQGKNLISCQQ